MTTNRGYGPELNPGTFLSTLSFTAGLDPAISGSLDTSVLLFLGDPLTEGAEIEAVSTAENGTIFYVQKAGMYSVQFRSQNASASPVSVGVNVGFRGDPGTSVLVDVPSLSQFTTQDAAVFQGQDAAGNSANVSLTSMIEVSQSEIIKAQANFLPGTPVRILASGGSLDPATSTLKLRRVQSVY